MGDTRKKMIKLIDQRQAIEGRDWGKSEIVGFAEVHINAEYRKLLLKDKRKKQADRRKKEEDIRRRESVVVPTKPAWHHMREQRADEAVQARKTQKAQQRTAR